MKRILRYFGYIHQCDLISAVKNYDTIMTLKSNMIFEEEVSEDTYLKGYEERAKGLGALEFVNYLLEEKL